MVFVTMWPKPRFRPSSPPFYACTPDATSDAQTRSSWIVTSSLISPAPTLPPVRRSWRDVKMSPMEAIGISYLPTSTHLLDSSPVSRIVIRCLPPSEIRSMASSRQPQAPRMVGFVAGTKAAASRLRGRRTWNVMRRSTGMGPRSLAVRLRNVRGRGKRGLRGRISWLIIGVVSIVGLWVI